LGFSLYLFLPFRAASNPAFNWGDPQTIEKFTDHLTRKQYGDLSLKIFANLQDSHHLSLINSFFNDLIDNFTLLGLFFSLFGFVYLWFKEKKIFGLIFGIFLFNSIFLLLLRRINESYVMEVISRVYYLPSFMMVAIWLAIGFFVCLKLFLHLTEKFGQKKFRQIVSFVFIFVLLVLPFAYLINNFPSNNLSNFWLVDDWSREVLLSLEPESKLVVFNDQPALDSQVFGLMYQQVVNHLRDDVKIINITGIKGIFYAAGGTAFEGLFDLDYKTQKSRLAEIIMENMKSEGPVYLLYPLVLNEKSSLVTRSNGIVYRIYPSLDEAKKEGAKYKNLTVKHLRSMKYEPLLNDLYYRDFLSEIYYARSAYYFEIGRKEMAEKLLLPAIEYDMEPFSLNYQLYIQHRSDWLK